MKSLTYYKVDCPKCHGALNSAAPLSGKTICPFCGMVYHITANVTKEDEMPEEIIPFATSAADFVQSARKMLVDQEYAPVNMSEHISFEGVKGIYLPAFLYKGKYECSWSCKVKQSPAGNDKAKSRIEDYRPQNGVSKGDYSIVGMACEGVESCKELAEYVRSIDVKDADIQPFFPDRLHDRFFLTRNCDSPKTWTQWGEDTMKIVVRNNTLLQLQGDEIKDFKCDITSCTLSEGRFIFLPVWMINYQYDGEAHHIFMDGTGRNGVRGTTLIDHTLKARAEKPFTMLKYIAVAAIVIPFLMLLAKLHLPAIIALIIMGLVFFGYRYYARWHKNRIISKARKEREKWLGRTPRNS